MVAKLPVSSAGSHLEQLIDGMTPGQELVLTREGEPLAVLTRSTKTSWPCQPGSAKDRSFWMAPDFDAPLEEFAEYME